MNLNTPDAASGIPLEVINDEKQLLSLIHTKGMLHKDVQQLFHKVRAGYQHIFLPEHDLLELQQVEYFLWKLHYKHIDEFRKKIKQCSIVKVTSKGGIGKDDDDDDDAQCSFNMHFLEEFKTFLSEANEFYKNLHQVFDQCCHPKELVAGGNSDCSVSVESTKSNKLQYACHRFLICLGDLARYNELCKKQDAQDWSVAFSYYLEAAMICPESGNPHNQLALLATYVGDAFLALYHCIRSLAAKVPFPDAWNNLMLLFEENRSHNLHSFSSEKCYDISKSSEIKPSRCTLIAGSHSSSNENSDASVSSGTSDLWPLLVRLTSFFLVKSSLEDFPHTLCSTINCLKVLLQLDDAQLTAVLESYNPMGSSRKGPYRVLHLVSVLIFIVDGLTIQVQKENLKEAPSQLQLYELTKFALVAAFSFTSPLLERCLKSNVGENFALLPAVLVFVEWLAVAFETIQQFAVDEEVISAMTCFFGSLSGFLNKLDHTECETASDSTALWEDYVLRGFEPTSKAQASLAFTNCQEWNDKVDSTRTSRLKRIFLAGLNLANRSNGDKLWLLHDNKLKKFYTGGSKEVLEQRAVGACNTCPQMKETQELNHSNQKSPHEDSVGESLLQLFENSTNITTEEEEVIVFNPLTRHSSAPLHTYLVPNEQISAIGTKEENTPGNERLRLAMSMFTGPKQAQLDGPPSFFSGAMNSRQYKPSKQPELPLKDMERYPAGPPSLSAWVFDTESSTIEQNRGMPDFNKRSLSPIVEIDAQSFTDLPINESKETGVDSWHVSSTAINFPPVYVAPVPSAPMLPDNDFWFGDRSSCNAERHESGTREADGILGAAPRNGYSNVHGQTDSGRVLPGLISGYPPLVGMSSSEWLYHYRNNHNLEQASTPILPVHLNGPEAPMPASHPNYVSRFDLFNPWGGNHLVSSTQPALCMESPQLVPTSFLGYMADPQRRNNHLQLGYQNQYPYHVYGNSTGARPEQQPLLYYHLKEKEWQLQKDPQLKNAVFFMEN